MNSIEVVSAPEKQKSPTPARNEPVLRIFTKEDHAYVLRNETPDWQQMVKLGTHYHDKLGKDILINEKNDPTIVHAKTNRNNDVDVGREIAPKETQGIPIKGQGEIILPSFYVKLPMDTKAFDDRERANNDQAKPSVEPAARDITAQRSPDGAAATPAYSGIGADSKIGSHGDKAESMTAEVASTPKAILSKTGYELPAQLRDVYTVLDGKFHNPNTKVLAFEDHGKKLSTPLEDRKVISHMVDVAAAKNWGQLELKGTETFKQTAWLEAQSRGIDTKGYKPTDRDIDALVDLRQARSAIDKQIAGPSTQETKPANVPNEMAASAQRSKVLHEPKLTAEKTSNEPSKDAGRLVAHGAAKFNFDPDEKMNYYVKLSTEKGEKTVWGKDLERALSESKSKVGDLVSLERVGSKPVTVDANKKDEQGKVIGTEEIDAQRNAWVVKPVTEPKRSATDKMNVDVATKVLEKAMAKYPDDVRKEALARMSVAVDTGKLNVPMAKVTERAVDKPQPAPAPAMDRTR